jgi:hypothetical protein
MAVAITSPWPKASSASPADAGTPRRHSAQYLQVRPNTTPTSSAFEASLFALEQALARQDRRGCSDESISSPILGVSSIDGLTSVLRDGHAEPIEMEGTHPLSEAQIDRLFINCACAIRRSRKHIQFPQGGSLFI